MRSSSLLFYSLFGTGIAQKSQTCYWPSGESTTSNYTACASGTSQCCASGNACLSNGLCFDASSGSVYRGGCTDSKWQSSQCPQYCNSEFSSSNALLIQCPPDDRGISSWWCGSNSKAACNNTSKNSSSFSYPQDAIIQGVAGTSTLSNTSTSGPSTSASVQSTMSKSNHDTATIVPIAVGLGVGVPLLVLVAYLTFLLFKERKRRILAEKMGFAGQFITAQEAYMKESYMTSSSSGAGKSIVETRTSDVSKPPRSSGGS